MPEDKTDEFKYIVRIADTNIDGNFRVDYGLSHIKGIGIRVAARIARAAQIPKSKKIGDLSDEEIEELSGYISDIPEHIPAWMLNRQKDYESGEDRHIHSTDLGLQLRDDVNRLKKIRSYRGIRHETGQRVRGQRTRSNGRTGLAVGVVRKKR
ncbi:MAG: 30S ribosomal protein S13 [Thermoplasmata archaeon]|nr:30S ribosomal protein S13 [Thermoplasmata archaeon]